MVFDRHPDELFQDVVRRGLTVFQTTISSVTDVIQTGDGALKDLDTALRGRGTAPSETTEQAFTEVLTLMQGTLAEARDKGMESLTVVQKSREVLAKINQVEPAWRPGPLTMKTANDMFRMAMRDLRGSDALIRLATGRGESSDLEALTKWADDINARLGKTTETPETPLPKSQKSPPVVAPRRSRKKAAESPVSPSPTYVKPQPDEIRFAKAVAEELGDLKVKAWAKEFADGKITEAQWQSRLTSHAAADRESLDDIYERALQRVARG